MRTEKDSLGEVKVPDDVLYSAQTQRAVENFSISGTIQSANIIKNLVIVKYACAKANERLGVLSSEKVNAICKACEIVLADDFDIRKHFPIDIYQTGSGTSMNMNVNEVLANLANGVLAGEVNSGGAMVTSGASATGTDVGVSATGAALESVGNADVAPNSGGIHPNDDVNISQSSNDVIPTCTQMTLLSAVYETLIPSLLRVTLLFDKKSEEYKHAIKASRTHVQDALPITFAQVFQSYKGTIEDIIPTLLSTTDSLNYIPLGGTAVGTDYNSPKGYRSVVIEELQKVVDEKCKCGVDSHNVDAYKVVPEQCGSDKNTSERGICHNYFAFKESKNHFSAQSVRSNFALLSGSFRELSNAILKIAADMQIMNSGPNAGINEINVPAVQPGSSIMPAKVNPVILETIQQVCARVIGNDTTTSLLSYRSTFELNTFTTYIAEVMCESANLLSSAMHLFADKVLEDLTVNVDVANKYAETSASLVTALVKIVGYDEASKIGKLALSDKLTIKDAAIKCGVLESGSITKAELDELLDPIKMTMPY